MKDYHDPDGGLGGVQRFQKAHNLSRKEALEILRKDDVYTLHRDARRKFKRRRFISPHLNNLHQADLISMLQYKKENRGFSYILVVIDCLSRFLMATPIKTKGAEDVKKGFTRIYRGSIPLICTQLLRGTNVASWKGPYGP